ncbi:MAG: hypothetical protein JXB04_03935 [Kiritimatiellae bacterium]|nr:hypothetical protein [Kiritimatiellia bacterium]
MTTGVVGGKAGYSLVEISLALLVAGLGIMAAFALFPRGLEAGRRAVDATEMSAFADYVFASIENGVNTNVPAMTNATPGYKLNLTHTLAGVNDNPPTQPYVTVTGSGGAPLLYYWKSFSYPEGKINVFPYEVAWFTYKLKLGPTVGDLYYARLEVWPGDQVATLPANATGTVFYREYLFYREGE